MLSSLPDSTQHIRRRLCTSSAPCARQRHRSCAVPAHSQPVPVQLVQAGARLEGRPERLPVAGLVAGVLGVGAVVCAVRQQVPQDGSVALPTHHLSTWAFCLSWPRSTCRHMPGLWRGGGVTPATQQRQRQVCQRTLGRCVGPGRAGGHPRRHAITVAILRVLTHGVQQQGAMARGGRRHATLPRHAHQLQASSLHVGSRSLGVHLSSCCCPRQPQQLSHKRPVTTRRQGGSCGRGGC
mmetsp:Transcript_27187/g.69214  ORF Transcript_27187/g.69214 Transcript_27187/m.69214 type:complete len:238 (+) Transcript_27187:3767-4480(+)